MPIHTLLEITDKCQLTCPICYSNSSPDRNHRPLPQIESMLDSIINSSSTQPILKISGGEPTIHPHIEKILDAAAKRRFNRIILDTNGLRISQDDEFAKRLMDYLPNFEVHLQFDSLRPSVLRDVRGEDITGIRQRALFRLNKLNLPTSLIVVVKKGQNDDELGQIIDYASQQQCVRGVIVQPIHPVGRLEGFDPARHQLTIAEIRENLLRQFPRFKPGESSAASATPFALEIRFGDNLVQDVYMQIVQIDGRVTSFETTAGSLV